MNDTLLDLKAITLGYGRKTVLSDVNLHIGPNEFLLFHGPNGGGKTTLLRLMAGLVKPLKGSVVRGECLRLGYLPQYRSIDREFPVTVEEVVHHGLLGRGHFLKKTSPEENDFLHELMVRLHLDGLERRSISDLSGGEWQRVLLARALVCRPSLLLLDEPDTHLDASTRTILYDLLEEERKNASVVLVSHDARSAARFPYARVCHIADGGLKEA